MHKHHEKEQFQYSVELKDPWPFNGRIVMKAVIGQNCLIQELSGYNFDDVPMPIGMGWHPWFKRILKKVFKHMFFSLQKS